jgi:cytochrome c
MNGFFRCAILLALWIARLAPAAADTALHGDELHGKTLYQACQACHSIDENDLGPRHRGVVGRRAGVVEDYAYSKALKDSGLIWDETTLDRWLRVPRCFSSLTTHKLALTSSPTSKN